MDLSGSTLISETPSFRRLLVVLCCIWAVLNFNVLFGGRVLPWDAIDQFYPTVYFNAHTLRSGLAPWWNPYIYAGYAQIGDPQGMMFSPLLMGWMLLRHDPSATWFAWGVLLHLLMGGAAMLALLRRHGGNAFGWLLGATVFMAGGVAASRLEHTPDVIAYAYVPVVLLALRQLLDDPGWRRGLLLGIAAGAMVTQLVQITYLFALAIIVRAGIGTVWRWPTYDLVRRRGWYAGIAVAIAVASIIGLPQLLFSWAALSLSNRTELPLSAAAAASLDGHAFLLLLNPNAFGALNDISAKLPFDVVSSFLYVGVLPALALYGLRRAWPVRTLRPVLIGYGVLAMLAAIYMLGTNTPVYAWLYSWLPGLIHFRRPSDAAYLFNFALALICGIAASRIDLRSRRELTVLSAIAICWLAATCASLHGRHAAAFVAAAVAAVTLWQVRRPGNEWRAALWLMLVLVADYRTFNLGGTFNESTNWAARFARNPAVRFLVQQLKTDGIVLPDRISTVNVYPAWDDTVAMLGIPSTRGYNPLRYALYEQWYQPRESSSDRDVAAPYNRLPESRLDDLLAVRYLIVGRGNGWPSFAPPGDYTKVRSEHDVDIWRNDQAFGRFLNPTRTRLLKPGEAPDVEEFASADFAATLWLTPRDNDDLKSSNEAMGACHGIVGSRVVGATPTTLELAVTASSAGWIAMSELDYPGWTATVDGKPVAIHRANGMFRAVCVAAGEHRLRFAFDPWLMVEQAWRDRRQA
jgi:hypothetical protein